MSQAFRPALALVIAPDVPCVGSTHRIGKAMALRAFGPPESDNLHPQVFSSFSAAN